MNQEALKKADLAPEENPFQKGQTACREGLYLFENPYPEDTDEAIQWEAGWMNQRAEK